jgi:CRP-like cAMP-binding protein
VIEEGDGSDEAFIILEGCVKVLARTGRDGHALIGFRKRGDLLGEMAALDEAPRSATVVACGDIIVQMIEGAGFRDIMDTQRAARQAVERIVIDRLRTFTARVTGLSGRSADVRVARVLAELSRTDGKQGAEGVTVDFVTQAELAATAGCGYASIRKILSELERTKIVKRRYGAVTISNPFALDRLADEQSSAADSQNR